MRLLGYIFARGSTMSVVADKLTATFNEQRKDKPSMTFKQVEMLPTKDYGLNYQGVLVFEWEEQEPVEPKRKYIGMPADIDPRDPEWSKKVWDKDRFVDASVRSQEALRGTEE